MAEEKFDVIIVGGGITGCVAAYLLAQAEMEVLVVERAEEAGQKAVTGGRMYGHAMEKIFPGFAEEAPVERKIVRERISFLAEETATTLEYDDEEMRKPEKASYSILRANLDPWLTEKAEEAGAMFIHGIRVDKVITDESGKAVGVLAGEEEMYADCILLADGVNSLLAQQLGLKKELEPKQVAVGVKEVIRFGEEEINRRFGVKDGEGLAWLFAGDVTNGAVGGGFLYTDKDSVSVGIVETIAEIGYGGVAPRDMIDRLKNHPAVRDYLTGGELQEYSAHLVTEGGYDMIPQLYSDGVIVAGDAAALVMNLGFTIRGMDLCTESARLAAETIIAAKEKGDYSKASLSLYEKKLNESFIVKDMKHYRKMPAFIDNHRIFEQYPGMMEDIMKGLWLVDGSNPRKFMKTAMGAVKKVGIFKLLGDVRKAMGAL
ncbi:MAG: FAD-dependent oxidoreductase [Lachnospiraceae bacterium]|uniref:FAD-dependent oxidoreductase n=1 Tax=Sarcina sp. DSM 11001 TaxID=1798184 RepID=UPI00088C177A|nr:FAD-dependent oxidoreductase [Sarcina sp. DSM 11001]MBE6000680.1 FAD-dependent oxidoreductase [Sarcina sp.]MDO5485187.1 FAD-dependent oxidoreductase [Sarcina sp.]SDL45910.1 electron transfer flavoprotein-quinone oxidoreductase [Sarcina sp. DSM 11001]HAL59393.1 FAD-dependent oxidoreductase [Sarcina sp.]